MKTKIFSILAAVLLVLGSLLPTLVTVASVGKRLPKTSNTAANILNIFVFMFSPVCKKIFA
ncbi:hypothetical protein [Streptococcus equi]|uniref:hypothetical protein n=1 Tax=Streptococcus equi TaxID=1336 RepID=UPI001E5E4C7B|nr:hypothetical protein [Streptococcus equi]MCD3424527.1 hypothetical protein [Streptococcus equi subsp. zooepidemicus]